MRVLNGERSRVAPNACGGRSAAFVYRPLSSDRQTESLRAQRSTGHVGHFVRKISGDPTPENVTALARDSPLVTTEEFLEKLPVQTRKADLREISQ